jgi:nucleoside-diphosphate-sugar epimerase
MTSSRTIALAGRRVLITGASGLFAFPLAVQLARANEVYALARFSDPEQKRMLEAAGVRPITFDLANPDLSPLPRTVDVVFNFAVLGKDKELYNVNAGAVGRLASRYRNCEAFVQGSTGSLYQYQGERPLREEDPYGLHGTTEAYAASKIAAEFLLRHLSEEYRMPTVILRIFSLYGPRGGAITQRIDQVARGLAVSIYPGVRNVYTPMYEDDYVEKAIAAVAIARTPAEIINFAGTEPVTIQEYCDIAGELLGKKPSYVENSGAWPIWADTTRMVERIGPCRVGVREGVRRIVEAGHGARVGARWVIGEPTAQGTST